LAPAIRESINRNESQGKKKMPSMSIHEAVKTISTINETREENATMPYVLLIDDETPFLAGLAEWLRCYSKKIKVVSADNARKALEIINTAEIAVVVADLKMPGTSGFELLAQLQRTRPHVPFIIMSCYARQSVEERLAGIRIIHYLEKPLVLQELAEAILACLVRTRSGVYA
jgi:YesN/AraC family two-component response regulator